MNAMHPHSRHVIGRRIFLASTCAIAASFAFRPRKAAAQQALEVDKVRLTHAPAICFAPQYLAEEFLRMDGFTQVEYVPESTSTARSLAEDRSDFSMDATPAFLSAVDKGWSVVMLAGIHAGCYELFGHEDVRSVRELKGRRVAITQFGAIEHLLVSSMVAYVGVDPTQLRWVEAESNVDAMRLFEQHKADAFLGFPPQPQELRAKKVGRVILNMAQNKPWSQYFCCALGGNPKFIMKYPVATKRVLRAFLKAADVCAREPERTARFLQARGYEPRYDIGREVLSTVQYDRWRQTHPEDTVRFHALRLRDVGLIKSTPQKIIVHGTDWRFLNELKRELKA